MVRIIIEIDGLKQLSTLYPEYTRQTLSRLEHIFVSHGFTAGGARGSYLLYQCRQSEVETTALLADSVEKSDAFLRNRRRRWNGFSMYVLFDDLEEERTPRMVQIVAEMHRLPEENGIWLDERAARLLSDRFVVREHNGVHRIVSEDRRQRREVLSFQDFFAELSIVEEGLDSFAPLMQSEEPAGCVLRGSDPMCTEKLVAELQRNLNGSMQRVYWLELHPGPGDRRAASILMRGIDRGFRSLAAEHLLPHERRSWERLETLLDLPPELVRYADALLLFTLYCTAYTRYMRSLLLPALMVCHRVDEYTTEQQEVVGELCSRFAGADPFLPVFTTAGDVPEELTRGFSIGTYDCNAGVAAAFSGGEGEDKEESGRDSSSLFVLYCRQALKLNDSRRNARSTIQAFFANLPEEYLLVLYALSYFGTLFPADFRRSLAGSLGMEPEEINLALRELEHYGLIEQGQDIEIAFPGIIPHLGSFLRDKRDYLEGVCASLVPDMRPYVAREKRREFIGIALELGREETAAKVLGELLEENLFRSFDDGIMSKLEMLLRSVGKRAANLLSSETVETIRLEAYLRQGNHEEARKRYRVLFHEEGLPESALQRSDPHRLLVAGEYLWRARRPGEALPYVKKALLGVQDSEDVPRILQARILIGKVMLSLGRVEEALEYFRSAKGYHLEGAPAALDLESSAFIALTHFVLGDYSLSLGYIRPAREKAVTLGRREWERYLLMLEGKLQFELGRYREASQIFQELLTGEVLYFGGRRSSLFYAWLYRSLIYRGYIREGLRRLGYLERGPEMLLFMAEGHILDRDLDSAIELTGRAIGSRGGLERGMMGAAEHLAEDGFDCFENYMLQGEGEHDLLLRHLRALHGFLAYNLGRTEEAEQEFNEVLGDKRVLNLDPYRHLYYFLRTLSFAEQRAEEEVQKLTLLSKAWQNLQKRAGRINDPEDRRSYLTENYWNSKLFAMSKENKLV